jgi:hypothetical protein
MYSISSAVWLGFFRTSPPPPNLSSEMNVGRMFLDQWFPKPAKFAVASRPAFYSNDIRSLVRASAMQTNVCLHLPRWNYQQDLCPPTRDCSSVASVTIQAHATLNPTMWYRFDLFQKHRLAHKPPPPPTKCANSRSMTHSDVAYPRKTRRGPASSDPSGRISHWDCLDTSSLPVLPLAGTVTHVIPVKTTPKNDVFWDVKPCGSCKNRRFGGT